ncbi:kinesin-like protein KIF26B [Pholidichthys leucotaenia]
MCQRSDDLSSYRSLPGSVGERIRSSMPFRSVHSKGSVWANPGSVGKVACCEKCSATLVSLKKQALSLAVHHHFSCKDSSDLPAFLYGNLRILSRSTTESREREREQGECGVCGTNLNQLKHEAVHLALSRGQPLAKPSFDISVSTGTLLGQIKAKHGDRTLKETATVSRQTHSCPHSPRTPQRMPQTLRRRGPKLANADMDRWVEEQQQLVASKSTSSTHGVTTNTCHKAADDATLKYSDTHAVQASSKMPHIAKVVTIANTAAMSFLARAAEKLNLTLRKKGQASEPAPSQLSTCFREIIQKTPQPVPSCLLQAATRTKDSPNVGKVKVVLRVSPMLSECQSQPPVLWIDPSKKRVTVMEPGTKNQPYTTMTLNRDGRSPLKTFSFDAAYSQESSQAEVGAGVLADVICCVLNGSNACVLGLGCADVGSWSSMVGSSESMGKLGLIPCAISWLYSAIERRRERTWTELTVSVSAIELCCGDEDTLRDLLGEVVPSVANIQDSPKAHVRLQEDPVYGIQLRNHNRVKAPTAERAASLLDVAIAARRHSDFVTYLCHSSIMFFTLHVQPPRIESSTIGKGSRGSTKLTMIDVCSGMRGVIKNKLPHSELGPIVLSLLSGNKTTPNKGSKLDMLLRESLGHVNCHTAVVAQAVDSLAHLEETFSIIQLASRIRKTQKRTKQSTSCSPCGRNLTKEKRGLHSFSLRAFHSTDEVDADIRPFRLRGELDERSSSDQSCDTVIQIDPEGLVHSKATLRQPEFVPIIPSLHPTKGDLDDPEFTALIQELLRIPKLQGEKKKEETVQGHADVMKGDRRDCLKCDTFAQLQKRLGCIDGSEMATDALKSTLKSASLSSVTTKSPPRKDTVKQADSEAQYPLLNQRSGCGQTCVGEKQTDGAFPGDSFQREDSGLYDCEECSGTSSSEELLNQTLSLNMTGQSGTLETGTLQTANELSSQSFKVEPQPKTEIQPLQKQENAEAADWFKPEKRASPIGKSSPISPSTSCSSSHSLARSAILGDVLHNQPTEDVKEMMATITVTVQQPLDLKGQDELVFSMVEEVTISGAYDKGRMGGNIICIRDAAQSQAHIKTCSGSEPIRIISNVSDETAAAGLSCKTQSSDAETCTEKPHLQFRREKRVLPSFINPMLIDTDWDLGDAKGEENPQPGSELTKTASKCLEDRKALGTSVKKSDKAGKSPCYQISFDSVALEDLSLCSKYTENKRSEKRKIDKRDPGDRDHVYSANTPVAPKEGGGIVHRHVGNTPKRIGVSPGCHDTTDVAFSTGSLPRGWQSAKNRDSHRGDSRGVTSSTPCSPRVTLERRQGRQHFPANHNLHISSPQKYDIKHDSSSTLRKAAGFFFEASSQSMKHENTSIRLKSPTEQSGRLFSAKLEQLARRTNSLGRTPRDFPTLERGSSNTSVSSKGSSKGSVEGACRAVYKENIEGESTFPRASRSPRKSTRSDHSHHFSFENPVNQSARHSHSKLSAVGKLKMASPKVRRLSAPSIKNPSHSQKNLHQSIHRSDSLSPDSKYVSFERTSSFFSSSPPRSYHSISRTPSQSSTSSSTKSVIQGFVNSRFSDLLKERASSPNVGGVDHVAALPSPYMQVTAPRIPDHMSGHASDTTSVLSGDLPPAMGKTSLHFSNRSSLVSSGYDSMVRDSEATGSSTSNRGSASDRSSSLLSLARSSRSSRRRGNTGTHHHHLSHDAPLTLRCSASGLQSRRMNHRIPEAYELKVYEIDDVQRMQKRAGAGKQGYVSFSAKLKFLEHHQQMISEVRANYNHLRRELEQAKHNLMLEPTKWNQEFDLWQTFEVDSLEHLDVLKEVTVRLENRVNICKANVMMITCFDGATRRRRKKQQRKTPTQRTLNTF